ncbi:MAG: 50S ribosomal protein L30, partial [Candidatus Adiutricales bacterium]
MAREIKITQIRSLIGRPPKHRRTIRALGLTKINKTVVHKDTPEIRGMIK